MLYKTSKIWGLARYRLGQGCSASQLQFQSIRHYSFPGGKVVPRETHKILQLLQKEGQGRFNSEFLLLIRKLCPTAKNRETRNTLLELLQLQLQEAPLRFSTSSNAYEPFTIKEFGSVCYGMQSGSSDMDVCILDPFRLDGFEESFPPVTPRVHETLISKSSSMELPEMYNIDKLASYLREQGYDAQSIQGAHLHLVKLKVQVEDQTIEIDVSINEQMGIRNSALIAEYTKHFPYLIPLGRFLKFWASTRRLNNSTRRNGVITFSSYSLILMLIAFLQRSELLPTLQNINEPGLQSFKTRSRMRGDVLVAPSFVWDTSFKQVNYRPSKNSNVHALLLEFFGWLGHEFDPSKEVISIRRGGVQRRDQNWMETNCNAVYADELKGDLKKWDEESIIVQDPFIWTRNTAHNITPYVTEKFIEETKRAHNLLWHNASILDICKPIQREPSYVSISQWFNAS